MSEGLKAFGRTLVIAPHPDDEVLGAGGTIVRLSDLGLEVFVAVVTSARPPRFSPEALPTVRTEAAKAHAHLGVRETFWLDQPAAQLSETPHHELNGVIGDIVRTLDPATLLVPFLGDIHLDHQLVFQSSLVAARPHQAAFPSSVLAYETLSETNWNAPYLTPAFAPNVYVGIEDGLQRKIEAMEMFKSQVRAAPHERSVNAIRALATFRGATVHRPAAEAYVMVRNVV